jgi:hypothetical protein
MILSRQHVPLVRSLSSVIAAAAVLLAACGGDSKKATPTTPTAVASASPSPTPAPPTGVSAAYPASCAGIAPPKGNANCSRGTPNFQGQMTDALTLARSAQYRDPYTGNVYDVVDGNGQIRVAGVYLKTVVDSLDRRGICAVFDGEEINARDGGGYNENWDIITAGGGSWMSYSVTCAPAQPLPPLPPTPIVKDPTCSIPPSASTFCVKQSPAYDFEIYDAQDQVIADDRARPKPLVFDFNDSFSKPLPYAYKIINDQMYVSEILKKLKAKGMCAIYDGDEFQIKRNNVLSENYDLTRADNYAIRSYSVTCRDSAF